MANYKIVDADQLDADLASVADSIRAKAGTTGQMAFPADFKSVVDGIQSGVRNQDITITENGTYTTEDGFTGFGTVTVEVVGVPSNVKFYYVGAATSSPNLSGLNFDTHCEGTA